MWKWRGVHTWQVRKRGNLLECYGWQKIKEKKHKATTIRYFDYSLSCCDGISWSAGLVMLYSTSGYEAREVNDGMYYLKDRESSVWEACNYAVCYPDRLPSICEILGSTLWICDASDGAGKVFATGIWGVWSKKMAADPGNGTDHAACRGDEDCSHFVYTLFNM